MEQRCVYFLWLFLMRKMATLGGSERFRKIRDIVENKKPMSARHLRIHALKNV
jgi:hypothetical protein